jgi:hypothetical protein
MPRSADDDVAWDRVPAPRLRPGTADRSAAGLLNRRTLTLAGGFGLAVVATLAVFLTDNRQYLQLAVIAMAWAFVLAAFAAGRGGSDRAVAKAREAQLRQAYELELEREVAARREYELDLEHDLRREAEDAMRDELDALRTEIASLGRLRDEVARASDLRHDIAGLSALRDEVARLTALRDDVAALTSLRTELGQLAELRADMGRLRADLTEQLSSEMLVERIVMRTQGGRFPADPGRPDIPARGLDGPASWHDDTPPRELTGGWPAVRLDEPRDERHDDLSAPSRRTPAAPSWPTGPGTTAFPSVAPPSPAATGSWSTVFDRPAPPAPPASRPSTPAPEARPWDEPRPWDQPRSWDEPRTWDQPSPWDQPRPEGEPHASSPGEVGSARSRHSAAEPADDAFPPAVVRPSEVPQPPSTALRPSPTPRPSPRPRPTPPPPSARLRPELPPLRRKSAEADAGRATAERPAAATGPLPSTGARTAATPGANSRPGTDDGHDPRLAEILAENGVSPSTGSRRRRRYREEGEPDDVLARVLGLG